MYRIVSNFDLIQFVASDVLQYFGFKLPVDATFGGIFPQMKSPIVPRGNRSFEQQNVKQSSGSTWAQNREKGKDRTE